MGGSATNSRAVRLAWAVSLVVCLTSTAAPCVLAAGDANRASCPPETEASPGFRTSLPDCRAYEMVAPPFRGGWRSGAVEFPLDGASVIGASFGAFAGATG